jgi:hypothetical protein
MLLYVDKENHIVPKWKKDAKEFTVSVNYNDSRGYQSSIPKPIIDMLGEPDTITFVIDGKSVKIKSTSSTNTH